MIIDQSTTVPDPQTLLDHHALISNHYIHLTYRKDQPHNLTGPRYRHRIKPDVTIEMIQAVLLNNHNWPRRPFN